MAESWPLLKPETLTDQVYEILRERVIAGTISPGEFIREHDVSERLGVSRTPVREALARLASEGFLERIPHRGFRLPEETVDDLVEIYPIMTALEVLGTREAFGQMGTEIIAELREINEAYARAFKEEDVYSGIENNHAFHDKLSGRSGNKLLCRMLEDLRSRVRSLEIWAFSDIDHWQKSIEEHEKILQALEKGQLDKAMTILETNRLSTYREFIAKAQAAEDAEEAS
jgi:DNA-binding GntR family transcriptional regulator